MRAWRESAPYWEKHRDTIRAMFAPITRAMIEAANITEGLSVLDVAGGSGEPALTIAEEVGPRGSVAFTDAVREMVEGTEREARRRRLNNISFHECPAESLPFEADRFDCAVCRLGIMFFSDPVAGVREMLRVTKPGGKIVFAAWRGPEFNPFFRVVTDIMSRYVEPAKEEKDAPGAFRFTEQGALSGVLNSAGATEAQERVLDFIIEPPVTLEEFWPLRVEMSDTLRAKVAGLSESQLIEAAREVKEAAREFFPDGRMRFPAQAIIASAEKPARDYGEEAG